MIKQSKPNVSNISNQFKQRFIETNFKVTNLELDKWRLVAYDLFP